MIVAEKLRKVFGENIAVEDLSFRMEKNQVIGFLGPNGAGKTTTLRMLTGYMAPSSGKIWIKGTDIDEDESIAKSCIGYLPESSPFYPELKVLEYLNFRASIKGFSGKQRDQTVQESFDLAVGSNIQHRMMGELSKGFRQRVMLAAALLGDPDILIFDEPTSGLDPNQIFEFRSLVSKLTLGRTIILSTHILSEVEALCTHVMILSKGKLVSSGSVDDLIKKTNPYSLSMVVRGIRESIEKLLNQNSMIVSFDIRSTDLENVVQVNLRIDSKIDKMQCAECIVRSLIENHFEVREIVHEKRSLEQIFGDFTR